MKITDNDMLQLEPDDILLIKGWVRAWNDNDLDACVTMHVSRPTLYKALDGRPVSAQSGRGIVSAARAIICRLVSDEVADNWLEADRQLRAINAAVAAGGKK